MKTELKPYPAYKTTEIEWLENLPPSWQVMPLKRVSKVRTGIAKGRKYGEEETVKLPYLRVANVQDGYLDLDDVSEIDVLPSEAQRYALEKGDVLMNEGGDADKLGRGHIWRGQICRCLHQNHVFAIRCKSVLPEWLSLLTTTRYARAFFETRAKQSTNLASISKTNLSEFWVVVPPLGEQNAILAFLDRETAKIDRLMEVRRKQVERLQEQRTAVIHHAVTCGLDPTASMKPSGVKWLGTIPIGWHLKRLGYLASVKARLGWKGLTAAEYVDDGNIFLSTPDIKGMEIDFENANYITDERYFESPEIMLKTGDVLLVKDGATLGIVNIVRFLPMRATVNGSIAVIRTKDVLIPEYLCYVLKSKYFQNLIQEVKGGMGVPHLFQSDIVKFKVPLPSISEQESIVAHLDVETAKVDTLAAKYRRELELLAEYRASLISHAVTGKIDVRGLVPTTERERL